MLDQEVEIRAIGIEGRLRGAVEARGGLVTLPSAGIIEEDRRITEEPGIRLGAQRQGLGWTQQELAERAGLALATYRRFERTGQISLERVLMLAVILDARARFDQLFARPRARTLAELEQRAERQ